MKRSFTNGESPSDVVSKINLFIGDGENIENIMSHIGVIMKRIDDIELIINGLDDQHYREEVLGYTTSIKNYTTSILDAVDSMIGE